MAIPWGRTYKSLAWAFLVLVPVQFFFAGIGVFAGSSFRLHTYLGLGLHGLSVVLIGVALLGRLPRRALALSVGLFVLIGLQVALVRLQGAPSVAVPFEPAFLSDLFQTLLRPVRSLLGGGTAFVASTHSVNALAIAAVAWANARMPVTTSRTLPEAFRSLAAPQPSLTEPVVVAAEAAD